MADPKEDFGNSERIEDLIQRSQSLFTDEEQESDNQIIPNSQKTVRGEMKGNPVSLRSSQRSTKSQTSKYKDGLSDSVLDKETAPYTLNTIPETPNLPFDELIKQQTTKKTTTTTTTTTITSPTKVCKESPESEEEVIQRILAHLDRYSSSFFHGRSDLAISDALFTTLCEGIEARESAVPMHKIKTIKTAVERFMKKRILPEDIEEENQSGGETSSVAPAISALEMNGALYESLRKGKGTPGLTSKNSKKRGNEHVGAGGYDINKKQKILESQSALEGFESCNEAADNSKTKKKKKKKDKKDRPTATSTPKKEEQDVINLILNLVKVLTAEVAVIKRSVIRLEDCVCSPISVPYCEVLDDWMVVDNIARKDKERLERLITARTPRDFLKDSGDWRILGRMTWTQFQARFKNLERSIDTVCKLDPQKNPSLLKYKNNRESCGRLFSDMRAKLLAESDTKKGKKKAPKTLASKASQASITVQSDDDDDDEDGSSKSSDADASGSDSSSSE